jgi:hypothetical protein
VAIDPTTPAEWQEAVDAAYALLVLDCARGGYGLVKGGPKVDVARCEQLVAEGKARGYTPADDCIERMLLVRKG